MKTITCVAIGILGLTIPVCATVTVLDYWHLGENDPGAAAGGRMTNSVDIVGGHTLTNSGSGLTYSTNVSTAANAETGSYLSLQISNSASVTNYAFSSVITNLKTNFGVEMWLNPSSTNSSQIPFYNGNSGSSGWGIFLNGNNFGGLFGGVSSISSSATFVPGTWYDVALVESNTTAILFVNGTIATTLAKTPGSPAGQITVGANQSAAQTYSGLIDEIRVFTFTNLGGVAQFSTNDLLINQKPSYSLAFSNLQPSAAAGTNSVALTVSPANALWTASANASWLHLTNLDGMGSVTEFFSYDENDSPNPRTGTLTIATNTFTVTQAGPVYAVASNNYVVSAAAGSTNVTLTVSVPNGTWTASTNASWLSLPVTNGVGSGSVTFNFAENDSPNPRTGTLTIAGNTVTVTQAAPVYSVGSTSYNESAAAGSDNVALTVSVPNGTWTASGSASWLSLPVSNGVGSGSIIFNFTENDSPSPRTGTLTVAGNTVTVTQAAPTYTVDSANYSVSAAAGSSNVALTVSAPNATWTASANASWLSLPVTGGTGSSNVTFNFTENDSTSSRTGTLTIAGNTVTVTQAAPTYSVTANNYNENAGAGADTIVLTVSAPNAPWTASANATWLHLPVTGGAGSSNLVFSFDQSLAPAPRSGTLTIAGLTVNVTQAANSSVTFNTNGLGWSLNGHPTVPITNNVFTPTTGNYDEDRSVWYDKPLYVGSFLASFTYQDVSEGGADGVAFVIQNDPQGTAALGAAGGSLGYMGITNSVAILLDIGSGFLVASNGLVNDYDYQDTDPVDIGSGDPIDVTVEYLNSNLSVTFADTLTGDVSTNNCEIDIPGMVGGVSALVGLTGADGASVSHQTISNFIYSPAITLSLSTNEVSEPVTAGSDSVRLTVSGGSAPWTAAANVPWLHLAVTNGTRSTTVSFTFDANAAPTAPPRSGTLNIAGRIVTVSQAPAASFVLTFNTNGSGWANNNDDLGTNPAIVNNVFTPTDGAGYSEARSAWFGVPVYVGSFLASFTYQDVSTNGADGIAFVIQNSLDGTNALGGTGGDLGYVGITPSVALMLNLYSGAAGGASGFLVAANGQGDGAGYSSADYQNTAPVNLDSGDPINVTLTYLEGMLTLTLADTASGGVYQTNCAVNIPAFVGADAAWVGFTGGNGGLSSYQTISDFSYYSPLNAVRVAPNALFEPLTAGSDGVTLTLSPGSAPWTAVAGAPWLHLAVTNGSGSATINFNFDANTLSNAGPRIGTLTIAGQVVTVNQASAAYSVATNTLHEPAAAGNDQVSLTVSPSTDPWTATADVPWLHLAVTNGSGSAAIPFTFDSDAGFSPRVGRILVSGQQLVSVVQGPQVVATNVLEGAGAGVETVPVFLLNYYPTPLSASANASWLHLSPLGTIAGPGNTNVAFTFDANTNSGVRTGTLTVQGTTVTVTQAGTSYAAAGVVPLIDLTPFTNSDDMQNGLGFPEPYPGGLALDGAGNLYIALYSPGYQGSIGPAAVAQPVDDSSGMVLKWTPTNSLSILASGYYPTIVGVDSSGNVYFNDQGAYNAIFEWSASSSNVTQVNLPDLQSPASFAVDAAGDIYYLGSSAGFEEMPAANSQIQDLLGPVVQVPYQGQYYDGQIGDALPSYNPTLFDMALDPFGDFYFSFYLWPDAPVTAGSSFGIDETYACINPPYLLPVTGHSDYMAFDQSDNLYYLTGNGIYKQSPAGGPPVTISTYNYTGFVLDSARNIYASDSYNDRIVMIPNAFVNTNAVWENGYAGNDTLAAVVPASAKLSGPFAPASDQPWLTITGVTNGVVSFSFTDIAPATSRVAHINVLGVPVTVTQAVAPPPLAETLSLSNILVTFSNAVSPATATNINNYSLNNGAGVLSATMGAASNQVTLTTTPLSTNTAYILTVQNVLDLCLHVVVIASVNVYEGAPQLIADVEPNSITQPAGFAAQFATTFAGALPISYQWQRNGTNLIDNGRITGSQTRALTIANNALADSGTCQLLASNVFGSASTLHGGVLNVTPIEFNGGDGWSVNGGAAISSGTVSLTDGNGGEAVSAWLNEPVDISAFVASWTYQEFAGANGADGAVFVLQNSPAGLSALGGQGGNLAYIGIPDSVGLEFNIYSANHPGVALGTNGVSQNTNSQGGPYTSTAPVSLVSGDPISVSVKYLNGMMNLALTDFVAQTSFATNMVINIPATIGSSNAYVGFTSASGGTGAAQQVSNFFFASIPTLSIQSAGDGSVTLTWPSTAQGFVVQVTSSLSNPHWQALAQSPVVVNGNNRITVAPSGAPRFYRLALP